MKKKEIIDLRSKDIEALKKIAYEKKLEAGKIKTKIAGGKEKNLKAFTNLRRDLARALTLIREKEIIEKLAPKKELKDEKGKEKA